MGKIKDLVAFLNQLEDLDDEKIEGGKGSYLEKMKMKDRKWIYKYEYSDKELLDKDMYDYSCKIVFSRGMGKDSKAGTFNRISCKNKLTNNIESFIHRETPQGSEFLYCINENCIDEHNQSLGLPDNVREAVISNAKRFRKKAFNHINEMIDSMQNRIMGAYLKEAEFRPNQIFPEDYMGW